MNEEFNRNCDDKVKLYNLELFCNAQIDERNIYSLYLLI